MILRILHSNSKENTISKIKMNKEYANFLKEKEFRVETILCVLKRSFQWANVNEPCHPSI